MDIPTLHTFSELFPPAVANKKLSFDNQTLIRRQAAITIVGLAALAISAVVFHSVALAIVSAGFIPVGIAFDRMRARIKLDHMILDDLTRNSTVCSTSLKRIATCYYMAQKAVDMKINLEKQDRHGKTVLHYCEKASIAKTLIDAGANASRLDDEEVSPTEIAIQKNLHDLVNVLLHNTSENIKENLDIQADCWKNCYDPIMAQILLNHGFNPNNEIEELDLLQRYLVKYYETKSNRITSKLFRYNANLEIVKLLVKAGADSGNTFPCTSLIPVNLRNHRTGDVLRNLQIVGETRSFKREDLNAKV